MLKFIAVFLMLPTVVWGQNAQSQESINLQMCGAKQYRFNEFSKECIYCAHGFKYDANLKCVGTPDVLGKCYGGYSEPHHYHAATNECMFCANGYVFSETSRVCEQKK